MASTINVLHGVAKEIKVRHEVAHRGATKGSKARHRGVRSGGFAAWHLHYGRFRCAAP